MIRTSIALAVVLYLHSGMTTHADVVLTFDHNPISNFMIIDQAYGDNVTVSPDANGHMYDIIVGNGLGETPNVSLSYGPTDPSLWTTGYGDLTNVYFNDADGDVSIQITMNADFGFEVGLFGFDAASFSTAGQTVEGIEVRGDAGEVLWSVGSTLIPGPGAHSDFDFPDGLFACQLTIDINLTGLGSVSDDIAIDNVHFAQRSLGAILLGDVNLDGEVNLLDVAPFVDALSSGSCQAEADIDQTGTVNLLDVAGFVELLSGGP